MAVGVDAAVAVAMVVDPDLLSPVVGHERKSIVPNAGSCGMKPAISV